MDDDTAKIIDFGVVHLAGSKSVTGQKGTFQYMSPEQAQLKPITPASDLFSLGVILYEALTLRKPFARTTADETMQAVIHHMPPPVSEINPTINQSVSKVVHKCLAKQPIHRFASARELSETLQKAFRNEEVFDPVKIEPRIERAKAASKTDPVFASEILAELEAEGHLDPRITVLRMQVDLAVKQKKIRQLLESARARMEQDEIALALDKLREALELDPQNADALAMRESMEKQRHESQIAKWFDLAQMHLDNRDFGAARNAVKEIVAIRSTDTRALDLLDQIESTEADARRIREQKEQLYSSAMRAYQDGEIETALSKLERLFSVARANPSAAVPERDAVYQSFYKEVRSESDFIHSALEDAQRQFSEKNFAGAMTICRDLLSKYPNDGTFHALKIRIEDAERQELSSYIAEVTKRVETEPDLDRRANILKEANERYPNEAQFAQQLKIVRERRDLVNSIVAKARQYEERGQYGEAISQWDILRNIHPQYPGITFELEQCRKKRDRQVREEEQARLVEEIDGLLESRAYAKAIECAEAALRDFPADPELSGLRTLAEQGLERTKESRRLFEEGQHAVDQKDLIRATDLLRNSYNLDPRGPGLRDGLVSVLAERARRVAEDNWREAEPLYQEASDLDSSHPAVRELRSAIAEAKRQTFVGQCLSECRALVAGNKAHEAVERIRVARAEYPNDPRLEQYEATLQKEINELRRKEERGRDRTALGENRRVLEQNPDPLRMRAVLEASYAIRGRHPDDAEIGQTVAEIELTAKRVAKVDDLSELLRMETVRTGTDGRAAAAVKPAPITPRAPERKGPQLVDKSADKTKVFPPPQPKEPQFQVFLRKVETLVQETARQVLAFARPEGRWSEKRLGAVAVALVLIAVVGYFVLRPPRPAPSPPPAPTVYVEITVTPADASITSNGAPIGDGKAVVGTAIEIARLGYKTKRVELQQVSDGKITLEPEAVHFAIQTSARDGAVEIDGKKATDLSNGSVVDYPIPADGAQHNLSVTAQGRRLFTVEFQVPEGSRPRVTSLDANDLFVVTTLGNAATIYSGNQLKSVRVGDQTIAVNQSGNDFNIADNSEIRYGEGADQKSLGLQVSNAPNVLIQSLTTTGILTITCNVERATLTMDGMPVTRGKHGWSLRDLTGSHNFALTANGYQPKLWQMTLKRGLTTSRNVELVHIVEAPKLASLLISGGTPGAVVYLDGKQVGDLDATGNFEFPNQLAPGNHTLAYAKPYYDSQMGDITASGAEVRVRAPLLTPWATVRFQPSVRNAAVKYRREGDTRFQDVPASGSVQLQAAKYEVVAESTGYKSHTATIDVGHENIPVPLQLEPIPDFLFADANQIVHNGQWLKAKNPGKSVNLKPGFLQLNLVFSRPRKTLLWDKKLEWAVELPQRETRVLYTLQGQKLSRRLVAGEQNSDQKEMRAESITATETISIHIQVDGGRVTVTNYKGTILDEYSAQGYDFSSGRISVRTDTEFLVRSDAQ